MKKYLITLASAFLFSLTTLVAAETTTPAWTGSGTAEDPYQISTVDGLSELATQVNGGETFAGYYFKLASNIDLSGTTWSGIGVYAEKAVGTAFQGTFDGNGKKITNVTFANTSSNKYRGFFNQLYRATVKNVTIETKGFESATSGTYGGAVIAGHAIGSTIEGCVAGGTLTGTHNVAGIVVLIQGATIKNCTNKAKLSNNYTKLAGIVNLSQHKGVDAEHKGSLIENCINEGTITSTGGGDNGVGGIVGWIGYGDGAASSDAAYAVTIKNCENKGVVAATASEKVGQIVGSGESYIVDGGSNKGLTTTFGIGDNNGYFAYATVENGVATYTAMLEPGNTYLVTAKGTKPEITLKAGESITFDESLTTIGDATGITSTEGVVTTRTNDKQITYFVEAPCATVNGTKMTLAAAFAHAKANNGTTITLDNDAKIDLGTWEPVVMDNVSFTLEGNGATITGLTQPLFASANTGSVTVDIKNLTISGANIAGVASSHSGAVNAGAIFGTAGHNDTLIYNVHIVDSVIGNGSKYAGGLVGYVTSGVVIENCSVTNTKISGESSVGGMVGHSFGTTIINSTVGDNTVTSTDDEVRPDKAGAVIGRNNGNVDYIDVTETVASDLSPTGTNTGRVVGSVVGGSVVITGGEYFADPTLVEKDTKPTVDGKIVEKDGKYIVAKAQIGESYYATLQGAVDAVTESANEIKLLGNVTELGTEVEANSGEFFVQVFDKDMTIDFAGFTLTGSIYLDKASTVKFKNGTITSLADNKSSGIESVGGNIELTDMTVFSSTRHAVRVKGGTAKILSGTYTVTGTAGSYYALNVSHTSTVTVEGGKFVGSGLNHGAIIVQDNASNVAISGGEVYNGDGTYVMQVANAVVTGGKFNGTTGVHPAEGYILVYDDASKMYEVIKATHWVQVADTSWYKANEKTFTLSTAKKLGGLVQLVNKGTTFDGVEIVLGDNVDLSALIWSGIGEHSKTRGLGKAFKGVFDGNGKTISGLMFENKKYNGFFNQVDGATVKDLTIQGDITLTNGGGAFFAGSAHGATFEKCTAEGSFSATHNLGGIVTYLSSDSTLSKCVNNAALTNSEADGTKLGGMAASCEGNTTAGSQILDCVNNGNLTFSAATISETEGGLGGLVGYAHHNKFGGYLTIKDSSNTGTLSAPQGARVGQLVGGLYCTAVIEGTNTGTDKTLAAGCNAVAGLAFATVADGVATYTATLEAGNTYLVTAEGMKPVVTLAAGESITFDQSLATIDDSGITAATKLIVDGYTYSAAAIAIGDTGYATLATAVDAANEGETITLLADIHLTAMLEIPATKNIKLDLAGKAITVVKKGDRSIYAFDNYGTLTLTDSVGTGFITARGVTNNGTMVMDGGTIYTCDTNGGYGVWNYADFTMNDGAIKTTHHVGNESWTSSPTCLRNENAAATATLNGGTLESTNVAVYVVISDGTLNVPEDSTVTVTGPRGVAINAGTATINCGTFTTIPTTEWKGWYALYVEEEVNATVTINGGIFDADGTFSVCLGNSDSNTATSSVTINGGTFKKPVAARGVNHTEVLKITGGKFLNWDPACANADSLGWGEFDGTTYHIHGYVAEGKIGVQDADGYYTLTDGAYVAKTETQCYATVEEAIAAAVKAEKAEDKVVTVLTATATWSKDFALTEGVTVKLADAEMVANATAPNGYEWNAEGVLIVKIVNWIQVADTAWFENAEPGTTSFTLDTARELAGLAKLVNAGNNFAGVTITLDADIDLAGLDWTPIGSATANPFAGTFDGDGKTISNLIITGNINFAGLFGRVGYNEGSGPAGTVKNVTIHNATIEGNYYAAAVVGVAQIATIDNCDVTGTINISTINNSVGGVVGRGNATIRNCDVVGTIKILPGSAYVGGIAGYGYFTIDNCHVDGTDATVSSISVPSSYVGGIQGFTGEDDANKRMISNCSVKNLAITGVDTTGGIVGMSHYGVILMNCAVDGVTLATIGNDGTIGAVAGTVNGKAEKPSKLYNCTVDNTTVNGATATTLTSALTSSGVSNDNYFVGSDVVLDKANKVTAGLFTVFNEEAAVNVLAENAVWRQDGDVYIVEMAVAEMNGEKFTSLQAAINAAIEKIENNESATIKLLADVTEDVEIAHVELIIQAKLKALMLMEAADASAEESLPTATLDLNGYRIDGTVTVPKETTLGITDGSTAQTGSIKELIVETGANAEVTADAKVDFDAVDVETEASFAHAGSGTITTLTAAVGSTVSKDAEVEVLNPPAGTNWSNSAEGSTGGMQTLNRPGYTVTVDAVGGGSVSQDPSGDTQVAGTELTLTAVANTGNVFVGWTVSDGTTTESSTDTTITVVITANTTITAHFLPETLQTAFLNKIVDDHATNVTLGGETIAVADDTAVVGIQLRKATTLENGEQDWATVTPAAEDVTIAADGTIEVTLPADGKSFFKFVSKDAQKKQ